MKIAIITSGLLPIPASKGGAIETLLDSFTKENEVQQKFQITIYSMYERKSKKITKINNYRKCRYIYISSFPSLLVRIVNKIFKTKYLTNKYYQNKAIKKINKEKYDFVIIENYPELALNIKNSKVILYIHSDVFNKETKNGNEILKSCYKVITVSDFIRDRVLEIDNNYAKKVVTIYNSIDFKMLTTEEINTNRKEIRTKYGINDNDFVYAYSGRISKEKGPLQLIKAFNKVNVPNKKLLIIGGVWYGSKKKNNYLEELERISDKNIIYTGYVEHKQIQKILCAVDTGVVPSVCNEAAGLSIVEFMASGAIVVASDKGGIKEYLNVKDNYLVNYQNEEQFINDLTLSMEMCYFNKNKKIKSDNNMEYAKDFTVKENYNNIVKELILEG